MRPDNPRPVSSDLEYKHASWAVQMRVTLIGLVRVADDDRDVERQHNALDPICTRFRREGEPEAFGQEPAGIACRIGLLGSR